MGEREQGRVLVQQLDRRQKERPCWESGLYLSSIGPGGEESDGKGRVFAPNESV